MSNRQIVVFKINEEDFGIEITQVKEIIRPLEIYKVPNMPDFIEGLINLREKVYTVFNLRRKFNLPSKEFDDNTKIIIVNADTSTVGFIVDEVNEIIWIDEESIESPPETIRAANKKYLSSVAKTGSKAILLLDLNLLVSMTEKQE
ncbi:MAG: chemotaxis protein CheW [Clostridia bacterium]|nr:chemotaxis protein CheW [Clostridia bacterium]